ncbi:hypothetical protein [Limibacterium fermenti]|uniref:hypothetical protein n=1 Tax=Limibacterium fermenti TaxID=3229863 RepID=UPI003A752B7C
MLLNRLLKWKGENLFPRQKHIIEFAFEIKGVKYYQFQDVFNLPYERGLMALAAYEEVRMRCTREYLEKHVKACRTLLHDAKIDIYKLNALNEQMSDRLNLSLDTDLLYKLASVVFFDKKENPAVYEPDYCKKKIAFWKEHKDVTSFFLQKPLQELIPFLKDADFDLGSYSETVKRVNEIHSEVLQACIAKNTRKASMNGK